jgi:biotin carboxylase
MKAPIVVIVDPYSSGNLLAPALRAKGFSVVAVTSAESPPEVLAGSFCPEDFDERIVCRALSTDVLERLRALEPVAVLAGADIGVELGDALAAQITPWVANDPALISARRHKGDMTAAVAAADLATIKTVCSSDPEVVSGWLETEGLAGRDLVIKPAKSAGTDGVTRVPNGEGWRKVFDDLLGTYNRLGLRNDEIVVQDYISGVEYAVNTFSFDGRHAVTDIVRYVKVDNGRHMAVYESLEYLPYDLPEHTDLIDYTCMVLDAVGVRFGPAHTEVMLTDRGPVFVETGARLAGGGMPSAGLTATGDGPVERLVRYLTGDKDIRTDYDLQQTVIVAFLLMRSSGFIRNTAAYSAIKDLPSYQSMNIKVRDGDYVEASSDLFSSLGEGFVLLVHPDADQAHADLEEIRRIERQVVINDSI